MEFNIHNKRPIYPSTLHARLRLTLLLLLCTMPLNGCLEAYFQRDFEAVSARPPQLSHPLEGVWEGSWQSVAEGGTHAARAVVTVDSQGAYKVQLELSGFTPQPGVSNFPIDKYCIELRDVILAPSTNAGEQFQTKTRLEKTDRSNLAAEAMTLRGRAAGDSLQIEFSTNDALNVLDHGSIVLHSLAK